MIYASNEPKSVLARDLGDCRDNYEKLAKRVSCSLREQQAKVRVFFWYHEQQSLVLWYESELELRFFLIRRFFVASFLENK